MALHLSHILAIKYLDVSNNTETNLFIAAEIIYKQKIAFRQLALESDDLGSPQLAPPEAYQLFYRFCRAIVKRKYVTYRRDLHGRAHDRYVIPAICDFVVAGGAWIGPSTNPIASYVGKFMVERFSKPEWQSNHLHIAAEYIHSNANVIGYDVWDIFMDVLNEKKRSILLECMSVICFLFFCNMFIFFNVEYITYRLYTTFCGFNSTSIKRTKTI